MKQDQPTPGTTNPRSRIVNCGGDINASYVPDRDVLYVGFGNNAFADHGEERALQVVARYREGRLVGVTIVDFKEQLQ
jgi:hypothetical protein